MPVGLIPPSNGAPLRASITVPVNSAMFDQESKGYEFTATANMTRNWRLTATYSYTDRIRSNSSAQMRFRGMATPTMVNM